MVLGYYNGERERDRERGEERGMGLKVVMRQSQDFIFVQVKSSVTASRESLLAVTLL